MDKRPDIKDSTARRVSESYGLEPKEWLTLSELEASERTKLRWLLRHAATNGIVDFGAAVKFGREWRINRARLPGFLQKLTLQQMGSSGPGDTEAEQR